MVASLNGNDFASHMMLMDGAALKAKYKRSGSNSSEDLESHLIKFRDHMPVLEEAEKTIKQMMQRFKA